MSERAAHRYVSRALGEELRRRREALGWSRARLVACMPSGIKGRTLLSYEDGTRQLTVVRLLELCRCLDVPAPVFLTDALRNARVGCP
jgi:transcriptional regulator with XRE-family HTH domain